MCNYMWSLYFTTIDIFSIPWTARYGRSTFYPHPLKMAGFGIRRFEFFLQRSPQNLEPSNKFFKGAD